VTSGLTPQCARSGALLCRSYQKEQHMFATIRRYEGVDTARTQEIVGSVNETLVPQLRELPGFAGYYLIEADDGILSSVSLFETGDQAASSTDHVKKWITEGDFARSMPNPPKITSGKLVAHSDRSPATV
jgi:hypothetical protein